MSAFISTIRVKASAYAEGGAGGGDGGHIGVGVVSAVGNFVVVLVVSGAEDSFGVDSLVLGTTLLPSD